MKVISHKILYHVYLFIFGVIYYWISPIITLQKQLVADMPGVQLLDSYDYESYASIYVGIVLILLLSFIIGSIVPLSFIRRSTTTRKQRFFNPKDIAFISFPFLLIAQFAIYKSRASLFSGYTLGYDVEVLGTIATSNCILLILYLIILIQNRHQKTKINKKINFYFLLSIGELSIVLLGFGSRMYVIIPAVAFLVFYLQRYKLNRKILFYILLGIATFLGIGVWRLSSTEIETKFLLYIGLAEPLFTWISCISFFNYNEINLLCVPQTFISSFVNFIPTVLFPKKGDYINELASDFDAPLGATSLLTSLLSDFGLLGSMILLFIGGYTLTIILYNWRSYFSQAYYCCVCGIIPFQLFRDGFSIVNKMVWFNFLILPLIIIGFIRLTYWITHITQKDHQIIRMKDKFSTRSV